VPLHTAADLNWIGWGDLTALDVAVQDDRQDFADWLRTRGTKRASELSA
jgi:hypothetical protein